MSEFTLSSSLASHFKGRSAIYGQSYRRRSEQVSSYVGVSISAYHGSPLSLTSSVAMLDEVAWLFNLRGNEYDVLPGAELDVTLIDF
jgi:hypothetical protein